MRASLLTLLLAFSASLRAEEALPDGFFEFLGMMVEQDGEWIDPLSLRVEEHIGPDPGPDPLVGPDPVVGPDPLEEVLPEGAPPAEQSARVADGAASPERNPATDEQPDTTGAGASPAEQVVHTEPEDHD